MNEFVSWESLATMGTATAFVLLVVQYIKAPLDKVWKIPTRVLVYLISLVCLVASNAALGVLTIESVGLCVANAFVVALAAMGAYEATFNRDKK